MPDSSPSSLILARAEAFKRCDFGFIYDSYHPASNFRRQFPERDEYLRYGWASLGKEFRIHACRILREEAAEGGARVIFLLDFALHGERRCYAELAWLEIDADSWRVRCAQKLTPEEWPVPVEQLDFAHFDRVAEKVLY